MLIMKIKKPDICDAATLHWRCQGAAKQPKMQLQNSCGAIAGMASAPHTARARTCQLPAKLTTAL